MLHVSPAEMVGGGQVVELVAEESVAPRGGKVECELDERDASER
jgi:hypothetical protein